jgi:Ca-activated chloride channel family protein
MNLDDPKLTAFALDELDEPEKTAMARAIADSPEAQGYVEETRELAAALKNEFAADLEMEGRAPASPASQSSALQSEMGLNPRKNLSDIRDDPWFWSIARPLAIAATLAIAALIAGVAVFSLNHKAEERIAEADRVTVTGANIPTAEEVGPSEVEGEIAQDKGELAPAEDELKLQVPEPATTPPSVAQMPAEPPPMPELAAKSKELPAAMGGHFAGGTVNARGGVVRSKMPAKAMPGPLAAGRVPMFAQRLSGGQFNEAIRQPAGPSNTATYDHIEENPFLEAKSNPLSTFSIDVDTASYSNIRRFLNEGALPPKDAVRVEEMINYFNYDYAQPNDEKPFAVQVDLASCPWESSHRLVRIGLKGKEIAMDKRGASNLVFLLDVSGSMEPAERLPLVKQAMRLLVEKLTENDRVAIVVYAGGSGLVLPSTNGAHKEEILQALENLQAGGSTNGAQGIELAYQVAQTNFIKGGVNRVILATDGDFNVGVTDQGDLIRMIQDKAKGGVFLSVLGVGADNLKDSTMQKLADKGNGNYAYLDSLDEARKVLVQQMNGTLVTIAKDVKIQVEFNPARVASYRLIGYEKRMLRKEDFNNDKIDAGEIGAGHTVTALYEVVPAGASVNPAESVPPVDRLKYQGAETSKGTSHRDVATGSGEILTVKLRYKKPDGDKSELLERPVTDSNAAFASASPDFKFAAAVAEFGMLLRDSEHKGNGTLGAVLEWAQEGKGGDPNGYRAGFIEMVRKARALKKG